jgi:uncharacterized LabA/DUF88 family protein
MNALGHGGVVIDFSNLHAGFHAAMNTEVRYEQFNGRHPQLFCPRELMARIEHRFGPVVVAKAYANWNFFVRYLDEARNAGVEPVFVNDRYEKNTDRVLSIDAIELACTRTDLGFVVIGSGDRDFVPLAQKLRQRRLKVYGVGVEGTVSDELRAACDDYVTLMPAGEWPDDQPKTSGFSPPRFPPSLNGQSMLPPAIAAS